MASKATLLFLVRHGETEWNTARRYQGQTDTELNEKGERQAELTAKRLAKLELHAVYSSDLKRASRCAEEIAEAHGLEVQLCPALRERHFGDLEGLCRAEAETKPWWPKHIAGDAYSAPPGGETRGAVRKRVTACLREIIAEHDGENVAIVSHGGPISHVVVEAFGVSARARQRGRMRLDNCSITIVEATAERHRLLLLNDTGHLYPGETFGVLAAMRERPH